MNELSPRINKNRLKVILGLVLVAGVSAPAEAHHIVFCCFPWHGPNSGFRSYYYKSQIALWGERLGEAGSGERDGMGFLESLQPRIIGAARGWTGPAMLGRAVLLARGQREPGQGAGWGAAGVSPQQDAGGVSWGAPDLVLASPGEALPILLLTAPSTCPRPAYI